MNKGQLYAAVLSIANTFGEERTVTVMRDEKKEESNRARMRADLESDRATIKGLQEKYKALGYECSGFDSALCMFNKVKAEREMVFSQAEYLRLRGDI